MSKKRIITIVAILVIIIAALCVFYNVNGHSLSVSDREARVVVTGSMDGEPQPYEISTIPVNSLVVVEHLSGDELKNVKVGDVLAFTYENRFTTHRVAEIYEDGGKVTGFKTIGDIYLDTPTTGHYETPSADDVIGVVVGVSPTLGKIVHFAQTSTVYLIMIIVIIAVMISVVRDIIRVRMSHD